MGNMCDSFIIYEDNQNEFKIWQGLVGAHYTPHVDDVGNLSWTNNGDLPNPQTVNISGRGLTITGVVATVGDLPETASNYDTYLVGSDEEYFAYLYYNGTWVNIGIVGRGEKGDTGDPATVTDEETVYQQGDSGTVIPTGAWSDTVPTITQGKFLWTRTTLEFNTGDPLVWYAVAYQAVDGQGSPGTATPLVDSGNGVVGTATSYSREDHQHPLNKATSGTPSKDGTGAIGSASEYALFDHVHPLNVPTSGTPEMDGTASQGSATSYSRSDHVHPSDTAKQDSITAVGILKGSGTAVTAATAGTDYQTPLTAEIDYQTPIKTASITIAYANWSGSNPYTQTITITGATITSNTKVDLQMDATAMAQLISDGVTAMFISNTSGTLTLYAIGAATTADITIQVTYYETA